MNIGCFGTLKNPSGINYHHTASSLPPSSLPKDREGGILTATRRPTNVVLLQKCQNFDEVKQLHAQFVVSGLFAHPSCPRKLLESCVTTLQHDHALSIFERMASPDVFAYNTMIRGLTLGKCAFDALLLYKELILLSLVPDNYTYTFVLKACSRLKAVFEGKQVHCQIIKAGIAPETHIHSSLIHMYANSGSINDAECVVEQFPEENTHAHNSMISGYLTEGHVDKAKAMFDSMSVKDDASWSAMVTGYTKNGMHAKALAMFRDMMVWDNISLPNESTLVSSLSACAHLGALHQGRWIHAYIDKIRVKFSTTLATSLIDMYAKCGSIESGYQLFRNMLRRDVVTWGVMISGFAIHGQAAKCFQLFDEMLADGIHPNEVIFVAILSACSHAGYVEKGLHYFGQMANDFGIKPSIEHYGCMVDILGRAGRLAEAEEIIISMPQQPNSIIWGTLLGACRTHNDLRRGRWAFRHLTELEPASGDRYKLAGHLFASAGEKEEATKIRKLIKEKEMETTCGSSFIEIDGTVHEFVVAHIIHKEAREIYGMWKGIQKLMVDC